MPTPLPEPLAAMVPGLAGRRVLVVGDITLDEYLLGRPTRLAREAPVPVLEFTERQHILGGAANPSRNIVALGSSAVQVGVVGADVDGEHVLRGLAAHDIAAAGVIIAADRPTTVKTRVLAHEPPRLPQQVARIDRLERSPLAEADAQRVIATVRDLVPHADAVLCSDYQQGLLSAALVAAIRECCRAHGVLLTVDAQGNADYYREVDLFRCNDTEAARVLGRTLRTDAEFAAGLRELRARLAARMIIVTRGPEGVSLLDDQEQYYHLAALNLSEVYDTTGAGDTFIAVVTLALVAGLTPLHAAQAANGAAGLVVRKLGNAVVTPDELTHALRTDHPA